MPERETETGGRGEGGAGVKAAAQDLLRDAKVIFRIFLDVYLHDFEHTLFTW